MTTVVRLPDINERYDQIPTKLYVDRDKDNFADRRAEQVVNCSIQIYEITTPYLNETELATLRPIVIRVGATVHRYRGSSEYGQPGEIKGKVFVHHVCKALPRNIRQRTNLKEVICRAIAGLLEIPEGRVAVPIEAFE